MRKQIVSSLLATALMTVSTSAMAAQIDGAVNADNRFTVAITQNGNVLSRYDSPSNYTWKNTQRFSMNTPEDLRQCRVNVIVWGDNRTREGFAGVLKGNNGQIYSGGSGSSGFASATQSSSLSGGFSSLPTTGEIIAMTPAPSGTGPTGAAPSIITAPVWGAAAGYYLGSDFNTGSVPTDMAWVKPQGTGNTTDKHWVFSSPCGDLVKPEMPDPIDVPGDHFQCYMIEKGDKLKPETLYIEDQFGGSKAVLGRPVMLCNPSAKQHNRKKYGVRNEKRHLVCYNYANKQERVSESVMINNQMGPDKIVVRKRETFCVPSLKYHLDKEGNVIQTEDKGDDRVKPRRPRNIYQRRN
ncbi:MAG: hypothetical protein ABJN69_05410 [Hellea sp.]